jgi:hypothetical protein
MARDEFGRLVRTLNLGRRRSEWLVSGTERLRVCFKKLKVCFKNAVPMSVTSRTGTGSVAEGVRGKWLRRCFAEPKSTRWRMRWKEVRSLQVLLFRSLWPFLTTTW